MSFRRKVTVPRRRRRRHGRRAATAPAAAVSDQHASSLARAGIHPSRAVHTEGKVGCTSSSIRGRAADALTKGAGGLRLVLLVEGDDWVRVLVADADPEA